MQRSRQRDIEVGVSRSLMYDPRKKGEIFSRMARRGEAFVAQRDDARPGFTE